MRVLFIDPRPPQSMPSLGIRCVSAFLKRHATHEVFAEAIAPETTTLTTELKRIEEINPSAIAIGCMFTAHFPKVLNIVKQIKQALPTVPVIAGGAHVTSEPEQVVQHECIDYAVVGEGEHTLLELLAALEDGTNASAVQGLYFRRDGQTVHTPTREFIQDLDSLPLPDAELFDLRPIFERQAHGYGYTMRQPVMTMVSSRGCPMNCIYCSIRKIWGRSWRGRSAENVLEEIKKGIDQYGVREIHFLDDNFSSDPERVARFCDLIVEQKLQFTWTLPNGIAIWTLNKELLRKMKRAGCYRLTFGLESGDPETLKFIRKSYNPEKAIEIIAEANRLGMWTVGTFIIGFPYEQIESINNTINFAVRAKLDFATFYTATPFPGTDLYRIFEEEGLSHPVDASLFLGGCDTKYFTREELIALRKRAHFVFFRHRILRAYNVVGKIRSAEDLRYVLRVSANIVRSALKGFRSFF